MQKNSARYRPWSDFFAPRYWPTWLGLGILRLIHQLPFHWQLAIGRTLGNTAYHLLKRRAHIARTNLRLCFPEQSSKAREALVKANFAAIGMGLFESALTWWGSDARIKAQGEVEGLEHLETAAKEKQGVIFLTGHFSTMELASTLASIHHRISGMYRPMKNPLMDQVVWRARNSRSLTLFPRDDIPAMIRCLKRGEAVWYGFDQNYGIKHALFTPFFGVPAATITTTSRFARMGRARVIPFFPVRHCNGRYTIKILPALENFPSGDDAADTLRLNQLLERHIQDTPEQYFWIHRRFKTRPENESPVY